MPKVSAKVSATFVWLAIMATASASGCGDDSAQPPIDGPVGDAPIDAPVDVTVRPDAGPDAASCVPMPGSGADGSVCAAGPSSNIRHLVVIIQENHSFDNYFGTYCTAAPGSNPTCTTGPACCEAGPTTDARSGMGPVVLDDAANGNYDPDHSQSCELQKMNGGLMDSFVSGPCGDRRNFAYAPASLVMPYRQLAQSYALADRYFQPVAGASSSNDMYFARARFVFRDNTVNTMSIGSQCGAANPNRMFYDDPTIADLLAGCGVTWAFYAGGYSDMVQAVQGGRCPASAPGCPAASMIYPCIYDPTDVPFEYYRALHDNPTTFKDLTQFATDVTMGRLPQVSFLKPIGFQTEHPGYGDRISDGVAAVSAIVNQIQASAFASDTLVLLVYDESGGYFDHVPPPPVSAIDCQPYGARIPMLAVGRFARQNYVSHVTMEHSSIVKFIEWNWLGMETGLLGGRDGVVHNIGSLLDPAMTGTAVPAD